MNTDDPDKPKPDRMIYMANMAEDVWSFIQHLSPQQQSIDIDGCNLTSDRELCSVLGQPDPLLILPLSVNSNFISYLQSLIPSFNPIVLVPNTTTGQISLDCLNDESIMQKLVNLSQKNHLVVTSYCTSQQLYEFLKFFQNRNISINTPEMPDQSNSGVVDYFGSKTGFRKFIHAHPSPNFVMSPGKTFDHFQSALDYAANVFLENGGVVLKTNKAHSGIGVIIAPPNPSLNDKASVISYLESKIKDDDYWHHLPLVVENFIPIDQNVAGGTPNAECFINDQGQIEVLYTCGMRIDFEGTIMGESGAFMGVEFGKDALSSEVTSQLTNLGKLLGHEYAKRGYRGYFDIDCLYGQDGQLYISESNVRRTGGTHIYHLAKTLLGPNFLAEKYIISNNYHPLPKQSWNLVKILELFEPILYQVQAKSGLIITADHTLQINYLSFMIVGNDKNHALEIESQMENLIHTT